MIFLKGLGSSRGMSGMGGSVWTIVLCYGFAIRIGSVETVADLVGLGA